MTEVFWSEKFKKLYRKNIRSNHRLKNKFHKTLLMFESNPFDPILNTHKLKGQLNHLYAFTIDYDCRVVFEWVKKETVIFLVIGTHDEVY